MARIDNLPANYLNKRISRLQSQLQELKGLQYAGSQNLQLVRIVSEATYDFAATVTYNTITTWQVTFTPNDTTFANTSYIWRSFWDIVTETGTGEFQSYTETLLPNNNVQVLRIYLLGLTASMSLVLQFKMVFYTLGNGTFSVAQIT